MFRRYAGVLKKVLPLSAMMATCYFTFSITKMATETNKQTRFMTSTTQLLRRNHPRIKFVRDLYEYAEKLLVKDRSIIIFELTGNEFIDNQVIKLAQTFVDHHQNDISADFQFIFLQERQSAPQDDEENYFILYSPNGQKLINIDAYINKCKEKPDLKLNYKPLMKRIIENLNTYKEVGLSNISSEFYSIDNNSNYIALVTPSQNHDTQKAKSKLKAFQKQYQVKTKNVSKYVVKDQQAKRILGINQDTDNGKILLIVPDSNNLRGQFKQKADFFSINGRKFTKIDVSETNLDDVFIFPPIQRSLKPEQYVLNVYINKNGNYEKIEAEIYKQLSKPEYKKYPKALLYTSDVQQAEIFYEKNDYSSECLRAYQKNTKLSKEVIRNTLTHTFQYRFLLNSNQGLDSARLHKWIYDCENNLAEEYFQTEKPQKIWAHQITGEQYKSIVQLPNDKVIYHYSHHCHGCKKFGGHYEEFARNKILNYPNINFYRMNNDNNKAEGVRNYNSTPVFVFYKNGYPNPFIYRMPIFTEKLFDSFLKITSEIKIMPLDKLQSHIKQHSSANIQIDQLMDQLSLTPN